jgi:N4-gp56 family major capsid protein
MYILFIDTYQAHSLRQEAAWLESQQLANVRGMKNPIFSGAMGVWDGVIIVESQLIQRRKGVGGSTLPEEFEADDVLTTGITLARALFCGQQAACLAQGQYPTYVEKILDYKTKAGYHTDVIYGVTKTRFDSIDFGVITVDTAIVGEM